MEKIIAEKFEDNLPQILAAAGYSTKTAVLKLNDSSIGKIESFVQANLAKFQEIIKDTRYENTTPFRFLPGHCDIIISLPKILLEADKKKSGKDQHNNIHTSKNDKENDQNNLENIKKKLINKIISFGDKFGVKIAFGDEHVLDLTLNSEKFSCIARCPYCEIKKPCHYIKYWLCSNFQSHLKSHIIEVVPSPEIIRFSNEKEGALASLLAD